MGVISRCWCVSASHNILRVCRSEGEIDSANNSHDGREHMVSGRYPLLPIFIDTINEERKITGQPVKS